MRGAVVCQCRPAAERGLVPLAQKFLLDADGARLYAVDGRATAVDLLRDLPASTCPQSLHRRLHLLSPYGPDDSRACPGAAQATTRARPALRCLRVSPGPGIRTGRAPAPSLRCSPMSAARFAS